MEANYNVVKDTLFGRLLGCSLSQVLQASLARGEGADVDMTKLNISMKVNDTEIDLHKLFTVFEKSLLDNPLGASAFNTSAGGDILPQLRDLRDALRTSQNNIHSMVEEAIDHGTSSYYMGEYAQDSARESAWEHAPSEESLHEEIYTLSSIIEELERLESLAA